jgi:dolichol-phosphate mannosyltransferase
LRNDTIPAALGDRSVAVVVPTYREVENLPHLIARIADVRSQNDLNLELLVVDDDSRDGTRELLEKMAVPWVRLIVRTTDRGLSQAVLEGLRQATATTLVVMDADLSHPPEKIVEMLAAIHQGADFVVGSRFADGGSTDDDWGLFRWLNSRIATLLALPLVPLKDPMSGFFALRRETFLAGDEFNPVGYKIGLELVLKCRCQVVREIPIHFVDRKLGKSKLSLREQLRYLKHVRRLYIYKFGNFSDFVQFAIVGFTGSIVNLTLLTAFVAAGISTRVAVALAIAISILWNFFLNRRFSFAHARKDPMLKQLGRFLVASSAGALVNYAVTMLLVKSVQHAQLAALAGIAAGLALNFSASRYWVFRQKHVHRD